jgi:hypothetical protein
MSLTCTVACAVLLCVQSYRAAVELVATMSTSKTRLTAVMRYACAL